MFVLVWSLVTPQESSTPCSGKIVIKYKHNTISVLKATLVKLIGTETLKNDVIDLEEFASGIGFCEKSLKALESSLASNVTAASISREFVRPERSQHPKSTTSSRNSRLQLLSA